MPSWEPSGASPHRGAAPSATATVTGARTPEWAPSMSRFPSCAREPTSPTGCSNVASEFYEHVDQFRHRSLDSAGPFTFVAADALTMKVREDGRVVNGAVLLAIRVNGNGHREILGMRVVTSETGSA